MRITPIVLVATVALSSSAFAASDVQMSSLTGLQVLSTLGKALDVPVSGSDRAAIVAMTSSYPASVAGTSLAFRLRLSQDVFAALTGSANTPVSALLATQAAMQSTSGRPIFASEVAELLRRRPELAALDARVFGELISNAAKMAKLNDVREKGKKPVTARGGEK